MLGECWWRRWWLDQCKTGGADRGWSDRAFLAMVRYWPSPAGQWQLWDESLLGSDSSGFVPRRSTTGIPMGRGQLGERKALTSHFGVKAKVWGTWPGEEKTWKSVKLLSSRVRVCSGRGSRWVLCVPGVRGPGLVTGWLPVQTWQSA